jgi:hypothetical protein
MPEGRTTRQEVKWALHNVVAHPFGELLYWAGCLWPKLREYGNRLHDVTIPAHAPGTGRG